MPCVTKTWAEIQRFGIVGGGEQRPLNHHGLDDGRTRRASDRTSGHRGTNPGFVQPIGVSTRLAELVGVANPNPGVNSANTVHEGHGVRHGDGLIWGNRLPVIAGNFNANVNRPGRLTELFFSTSPVVRSPGVNGEAHSYLSIS